MLPKKALTVAIYEFTSTLKRRSAIFVMFGLPLLSLALVSGLNWLADRERSESGTSALSEFALGGEEEESLPIGVVDQTGRLQTYPPDLTNLTPMESEAAAQAAYEAGDIEGYLVVPAGYLENGEVSLYADSRSFTSPIESQLEYLLAANFIDDAQLARLVISPAEIEDIDVAVQQGDQASLADSYILGIGIAMLFYFTAISAAGYLLQSLGKEKQNRVMEILLSSLRPIELLVGKMLGLGAIGFLQLLIWGVIYFIVFGRSENSMFQNLPLPTLKVGVWFIVMAHFIAGYLVYAGMFAGLGAIAPNPKESGQITFLFMIPILIPMWLNSIILSDPNGTLSTALSLFPLTSPISMPMRLAGAAVPTWQWLLSLATALLVAFGTIILAARIFRSQVLLSGQSLTLKLAWQLIRGS